MLDFARHVLRLGRIGWTLARHDALWPLELAQGLETPAMLARLVSRKRPERRRGERLAAALQALGPTFVKFGQALSTRADLLGEEVADDLSDLQDHLPALPFETMRKSIEDQFETPLGELFSDFDTEAVAAASIAQVHLARTPEGAPVAVKILRPGIEQAVANDLRLFLWVARWLERLAPFSRRLHPVDVVQTFAESVRIEMDLRLEAAAATELAGNFSDEAHFRVPSVDWRRTARRVLTLERVEGLPVDEVDALRAAGHDPDAIMATAAEIFFKQVFRDGFFHADMHAGNIFVAPDGAIVPVDFGIMGRLDRPTREYLAEMLLGFLSRDYERVAAVHFRAGYVPADQSQALFAQAARSIGEPILERPLNEISVARLLRQLFRVTAQFRMETQPQLLLLQKTMLMAEGMGRRLNPNVNIWEMARPLIEEWMLDRIHPVHRAQRAAAELRGRFERFFVTMDRIDRALERIAEGETSRRRGIPVQIQGLLGGLALLILLAAILFG